MASSRSAEAMPETSSTVALPPHEDEAHSDTPPTPGASAPAGTWAVRLIGTLLFVALIVWLDMSGTLPLAHVWRTLSGANLWLVTLSIALYFPFVTVKALRWRLVSSDMRMPLGVRDALAIYAIGLAAGTFTPGQAGDAVKAFYLGRMGYPLGRAIGGSVLDRLFDVAALAAVGLVGVAVYGQRFAGQVPTLVVLALLCAGGLAFFAWSRTRLWAFELVKRRIPNSSARAGQAGAAEAPTIGSWSLAPSTVAAASLLTVASFAISIFRVWLLAAALGIWLGPLEVTGFVGLTTAAALVPVSVGGIGTRDVVAALAFAQLGRPGADGVAISVLILALNLAQAVVGWMVWLRYPRSGVGSEAVITRDSEPLGDA